MERRFAGWRKGGARRTGWRDFYGFLMSLK
jgi:hypothetical protein